MNAHSMAFSKIIDIDRGAREHYHVPKYQREYTWGKWNWEQLIQDILENPPGYFMGSIICVKDGDVALPGDEVIYEVVDGQQRLATLSLMMAAIYSRLRELEGSLGFETNEDEDDFRNTLTSLRNKLIKKKKRGDFREGEPGGFIDQSRMCFLRVQPSSQNNNLEDYKYILSEIGLLKDRSKPRYCGVRTMYKAFRYFKEQISADADLLLSFVTKINQLNFVHISVNTQADAFTLFETLNNRGVPLSAIDIVKNKILAEMERQCSVDIDDSYEGWQNMISAVPDTSDQERFLRHFYNAFRWDKNVRVEGIPRAIKSKIIAIYETLIKNNAQFVFEELCKKAELYGQLLTPGEANFEETICQRLADLSRINAAPAYQILLYLFCLPADSFTEPDFLSSAVGLLCKYYVRRNVTDFPPTRELDQLHMKLVEACQKRLDEGEKLSLEFLRKKMLDDPDKVSSQEVFERVLRSSMYATNSLMTRYLLIKLNEIHHTREYDPDLWKRDDKGRYVWTIEHVMPKTEKISREWIAMLADGDEEKANILHEKQVHRLGNLTLSGYNSKLATAPFEKKQKLSKARKFLGYEINIGYQNGLALNQLQFNVEGQTASLASAQKWCAEMIEARTDLMVNMLLKLYSFEE